jgi:hypothetical protein
MAQSFEEVILHIAYLIDCILCAFFLVALHYFRIQIDEGPNPAQP